MVEQLPNKCEALSSNPSTENKQINGTVISFLPNLSMYQSRKFTNQLPLAPCEFRGSQLTRSFSFCSPFIVSPSSVYCLRLFRICCHGLQSPASSHCKLVCFTSASESFLTQSPRWSSIR
jgi:hypothetical protein